MSVADIADKIICMLPQSQKDLLKKIHEALRYTGKQFHLHNHYSRVYIPRTIISYITTRRQWRRKHSTSGLGIGWMPHLIEDYPTRRNGNALFKEMYYLLTNIKCCFFPIIYSPSHEEDHGRVPTSSEELGEEDGDNDPDRFSPEAHSSPEQ